MESRITRRQAPEEESQRRQLPSELAETRKSFATDQSKSGREDQTVRSVVQVKGS